MPSASVPDPLPDSLSTQAYLRGLPGVPRFIFPANGYAPTVRQTRRASRGAERRSLMIVMAATEILARSTTLTSVGWVG
jgi:hypothetical protein